MMLHVLLKLAWKTICAGVILSIAFVAEITFGWWAALIVVAVGFKAFWNRVYSYNARVEWDEETGAKYHADATQPPLITIGQLFRNVFAGRMLITVIAIVVLCGAVRETMRAFDASKRWVQKQTSSLTSEPSTIDNPHSIERFEANDSTEQLENIPFSSEDNEVPDDSPGRWM